MEGQREWIRVRESIPGNFVSLTTAAAQLYPDEVRLDAAGMLAQPGWMLEAPIDLSAVDVVFDEDCPPAALDGSGEVTSHVRPSPSKVSRYSEAIRDLAPPQLFENRPCWRLADARFTTSAATLSFSTTSYFDAVDICGAVAHEFAAAHLLNQDRTTPPSWRRLRFREAIGNPFGFGHRPAVMSVNTLTIRRDKDSATILLHNRDAANVATSGGVIGVMPAGVFQPSSAHHNHHSADFDLWHNIMREYSEEFLGNPEPDGADYTTEPLRSLEEARRSGGIRVHCFGLAMGALDLWPELETVAVFDAEVFDELFAGLVSRNDEGSAVRVGTTLPTVHIPLTRDVIDDLWATGRLAPQTLLCLNAAWKHRDQLFVR